MGHRRSKIEIYMDILDVARHGLNPTRIAYRANVSYRQFQESIDFLMKKELLRVDGINEKSYATTDKGKDLLENWYVILEILNDLKPSPKSPRSDIIEIYF